MITVYSHRYDSPKWQAYVTPASKAFRFQNGLEIRSLFELKQALLNVPEDVVLAHVNEKENHLIGWVKNAVGDDELANALSNHTNRWGLIVNLERQMMRTLNLPDYVAKRWLSTVENPFTFTSGESVQSLDELAKALSSVPEESILFHLERHPNDIAVWVDDITGDYLLAELLEECTHREQMQRFVEDHLIMLHEAEKGLD